MEVKEVSDSRAKAGPFSGNLELKLVLTGTALDRINSARVLVKEARDDKGNELWANREQADFQRRDYNMGEMTVRLKNPARAAKTMRVTGTVELFVPAKDPNSIVKIDKVLSKMDKPLSSKSLKAEKLSITILSPKKQEEKRGANKLDDKKIAEIRAEAKKEGVDEKEKDVKTPARVPFVLKNPAREAVVVKEVRGEVELYMPDKDKDAVAVLPKFQSLAGKPVTNKALKASGIEVSVIGKAQRDAEKKKASKAKLDELKKEGTDDETIKWMISSFEESFYTPGEGEVALRVKDPNKRVHEYAFLDGAGTPQRVYPRDQDGLTVLSTYGSAIDPSWGLQIKLRTPKTMAHYTFALNDVELP